jgi:hypothetical protein
MDPMKTRFALFALALFCAPAFAQSPGTVANHAVPIGKGPGVSGFGAAAPGTAGLPLLSTGASTDPAFGPFTSLAINGCTIPGGAVLCAAGNIVSTTGMIAPGYFGGSLANSTVSLSSTTSGSPSGDAVNIYGSTISLGVGAPSAGVINLGTFGGGGTTINIAGSGNGLAALNVYNLAGGKQVWVPGAGSGTTPGTIQFPAGNLTLATLTGTETLASKTLTSPVVNGAISGTALATAAQYFAGTATGAIIPPSVIYPSQVAVTYGATTTFDFSTFINAGVTLTGPISTQTLSNVTIGKAGFITFTQDATGGRTSVFNTIFKFAGGVIPTLTPTANAIDVLAYNCLTATFCVASLLKDVRNP